MVEEGSVRRLVVKIAVGAVGSIELGCVSSGSVEVRRAEEHIAAGLLLSMSCCSNHSLEKNVPPFPFPPGGAIESQQAVDITRLRYLRG